jgi:hypothetical protein
MAQLVGGPLRLSRFGSATLSGAPQYWALNGFFAAMSTKVAAMVNRRPTANLDRKKLLKQLEATKYESTLFYSDYLNVQKSANIFLVHYKFHSKLPIQLRKLREFLGHIRSINLIDFLKVFLAVPLAFEVLPQVLVENKMFEEMYLLVSVAANFISDVGPLHRYHSQLTNDVQCMSKYANIKASPKPRIYPHHPQHQRPRSGIVTQPTASHVIENGRSADNERGQDPVQGYLNIWTPGSTVASVLVSSSLPPPSPRPPPHHQQNGYLTTGTPGFTTATTPTPLGQIVGLVSPWCEPPNTTLPQTTPYPQYQQHPQHLPRCHLKLLEIYHTRHTAASSSVSMSEPISMYITRDCVQYIQYYSIR